MRQTWRWFGPADRISLPEIRQTGAVGIVSALHHVMPGEVWSVDEIAARREMIEAAGLTWDVVESLPVSEAVKTQTGDYRAHYDAYRESLRNLAEAGPAVICYNFMPVLDWTRTSLRHPLPSGGTAMRFDLVDFAVFDLHLLARPGAAADYPDDLRAAAEERLSGMDDNARAALVDNIVAGLPGANDNWSLDEVRSLLATYDGIDAERLRGHLVDFLGEVVPEAERLGLRLCAHPDDPPYDILGLPRILSVAEDYEAIVAAVDSPANGVTMCTGSLGVRPGFDPTDFVGRLGPKIHFAHLRNTRRDAGGFDGPVPAFEESEHLDGDTDMVAAIRALMQEEARRRAAGRSDAEIPMRPDHGHDLLADLEAKAQPGYPLIGRLRGLAELRGVMAGLAATI
ncbi:mannonate dehydratase [Rhodobacterales bacterium HKCCE2091]|nr:mannonate dehydratase [Rhodobacterales bacterium HKCCE2091]